MNSEEFAVQLPEKETVRVDKFVASLGLFSRSQISRRSVRVRDVSGRELKASRRLRGGEVVTVDWDDPPPSDILPEAMHLDVLYEDETCILINKPQGIVVHPAIGHNHGTLVQGLLHRYAGLDELFGGDRVRPGVVHRLDKDTSGLIIAARNPESLERLSRQFRDRVVRKTYIAVTRGIPVPPEAQISESIGRDPRDRKKYATGVWRAKDAMSRYRVLAESGSYALVQVRIFTGRTHQIRVHMKSIGCPVLGDPIYGKTDPAFPDATLMLHSWKLGIEIPDIGKKRFEAPLPDRFIEILKVLEITWPPEDSDTE